MVEKNWICSPRFYIFNQSIIKNIVINEDQLDEFELNRVLRIVS